MAGSEVRFEPGQQVLHRMFTGDRLVFVRTATVVDEDERGLRLWIPHGGPAAVRMSQDGRGIRDMPFAEWVQQPTVLTKTTWWGPNIFMLVPPRAAHTVWWLWDARGSFSAWYVNLEDPLAQWQEGADAGVDGCDHDLDVWVYPDRTWEWKDTDELEERLGFPEHYWVGDHRAVWAEGEKVVRLVEEGRFPFDGTWCDFRPHPSWLQPASLPAGWDRPRRRAPRASGEAVGAFG